jgi:hypothetical protein
MQTASHLTSILAQAILELNRAQQNAPADDRKKWKIDHLVIGIPQLNDASYNKPTPKRMICLVTCGPDQSYDPRDMRVVAEFDYGELIGNEVSMDFKAIVNLLANGFTLEAERRGVL